MYNVSVFYQSSDLVHKGINETSLYISKTQRNVLLFASKNQNVFLYSINSIPLSSTWKLKKISLEKVVDKDYFGCR